ncbi:GNAT family N-acetyltransferase [Maritalea sp.]|uniref:GNAT family N-acetyltransferase n=1 Tax=Maritalea sp. TaxID=2003361 RepID=UPI003EF9EFBE
MDSSNKSLELRTLKRNSNFTLPIPEFPDAILRPVCCSAEHLDASDVAKLTSWRNMHVKSFLTEFDATDQQTADWLINRVSGDDGKILFMVDYDKKTVGHVGLGVGNWERSYVEADAIVRGEPAPSGLMKRSLLTLLHWANNRLGLSDQWVRVRSDNPACEFYRKVGFVEQKRVSLNKRQEANMLVWFEDPEFRNAEAALVYMKLDPNVLDQIK